MSLGNFKTIVETADKMLTATRAREFTESVRARGSFELAPQPGIELVLPPPRCLSPPLASPPCLRPPAHQSPPHPGSLTMDSPLPRAAPFMPIPWSRRHVVT
mgnify:CR=1 FL=1